MKKEYEKSVIFRLGRILTGGPRGPGVFFIIPCVDIYQVLIHIKFNFVFLNSFVQKFVFFILHLLFCPLLGPHSYMASK